MSTADNQSDPVHVSTEEETSEQPQAEQSKKSDPSGMYNSIDRLRSEFDKIIGGCSRAGRACAGQAGYSLGMKLFGFRVSICWSWKSRYRSRLIYLESRLMKSILRWLETC